MHSKRPRAALAAFLVLSSAPLLAAASPRHAFVTSVSGTADLSSWSGFTGIENGGTQAADAICRQLAGAAQLDDPDSYVAWISSTTDDAFCRIQGLTGKKAANCGQPSLPTNAGPWLRLDGRPFAPTLAEIAAGKAAALPVVLDELGREPDNAGGFGDEYYWTGSNSDGTVSISGPTYGTCEDWTLASGQISAATGSRSSSSFWANAGGRACWSSPNDTHLLCMQAGTGTVAVPPPAAQRYAFVTSVAGTGDLSNWAGAGGNHGIAAGDAICVARANAADLADAATYKALLSDSTASVAERFTHNGPWMRLDGELVAESIADLLDGRVRATLQVDELGQTRLAQNVWTGTDPSGAASGSDCGGWSDATDAEHGTTGTAEWANSGWTTFFTDSPLACDTTAALFCFSDLELPFLFSEDFESGSSAAWD